MSEPFDFSTLIADRKQSDVSDLLSLLQKPLGTWTQDEFDRFNSALLKGAYDYTDLNRVTACMEYLDKELKRIGYESGYAPVSIDHPVIPAPSRLPTGYTELEYIESTGTQRIDTGVKPNKNTRVIMDLEVSESQNTAGHLCSVVGSKYWILSFNPTTQGWWKTRYGSSDIASFSESINTRERLNINKNKNTTTILGETISFPEEELSMLYQMSLFCRNSSGTYDLYLSAKLYSCKIYDGENILHDFAPCKNEAGNVGLYDFIDSKFYGNSGTGTFLEGPVYNSAIKTNPYIWYKEDSPTETEMDGYIANVKSIRSVFAEIPQNPKAPESAKNMTIKVGNNIETILLNINKMLENIKRTINLGWALGIADIGIYGGL